MGDNWYPSSSISDAVLINGKYYPAGTTAATANDANEIKPVENVIASMHNPEIMVKIQQVTQLNYVILQKAQKHLHLIRTEIH